MVLLGLISEELHLNVCIDTQTCANLAHLFSHDASYVRNSRVNFFNFHYRRIMSAKYILKLEKV